MKSVWNKNTLISIVMIQMLVVATVRAQCTIDSECENGSLFDNQSILGIRFTPVCFSTSIVTATSTFYALYKAANGCFITVAIRVSAGLSIQVVP